MKTITDILKKSDSNLAKLINKSKSSQNLEIIFSAVLDPNLTKHCHFASYKNSVLTVIVSNTSWATRIRYAIPDIIKQLQTQPEFKTITDIRYTIFSPKIPLKKTKNTSAKISSDNKVLWQNTLNDLKEKAKNASLG